MPTPDESLLEPLAGTRLDVSAVAGGVPAQADAPGAGVAPANWQASATNEQDASAAASPAGDAARAPNAMLLASELRVVAESWMLAFSWPVLSAAPMGDGHPVLVLPGMFTGDAFTAPLRSFLAWRGFAAYPWDLGVNLGGWDVVEGELLAGLRAVCERHGRKASLVGSSSGGLFARALASRHPELVRCVVTLASNARGPARANNIWPVYERLHGAPADGLVHPAPPAVPSTSVYSRSDGITDWRCCLQPASSHTENVEVVSSHHGLSHHPAVLLLVADRLAQAEGQWRPFEPPPWAAALYPAPAPAPP